MLGQCQGGVGTGTWRGVCREVGAHSQRVERGAGPPQKCRPWGPRGPGEAKTAQSSGAKEAAAAAGRGIVNVGERRTCARHSEPEPSTAKEKQPESRRRKGWGPSKRGGEKEICPSSLDKINFTR